MISPNSGETSATSTAVLPGTPISPVSLASSSPWSVPYVYDQPQLRRDLRHVHSRPARNTHQPGLPSLQLPLVSTLCVRSAPTQERPQARPQPSCPEHPSARSLAFPLGQYPMCDQPQLRRDLRRLSCPEHPSARLPSLQLPLVSTLCVRSAPTQERPQARPQPSCPVSPVYFWETFVAFVGIRWFSGVCWCSVAFSGVQWRSVAFVF